MDNGKLKVHKYTEENKFSGDNPTIEIGVVVDFNL